MLKEASMSRRADDFFYSNPRHPELREGELFLTNLVVGTNNEIFIPPKVSGEPYRIGNKAYGRTGEIPNMVPIFRKVA